MIYIYNISTLSGLENEIKTFRVLYESAFPDSNEIEKFSNIEDRIREDPLDDNPCTFIILSTEDKNNIRKITGGIIADWYKGCPVIHLTYIVVDPEERGKRIAYRLISEGLPEMRKIIAREFGEQLKHVIFESNIPWETRIDSFDSRTRLLIFHKLGAKWIDIPYVQPALGPSKKRVRNLFLLVFQCFGNDEDDTISNDEVRGFLSNLYRGLATKDPKKDTDFIRMTDGLNNLSDKKGTIKLKNIPGEFPRYRFQKVSVTIHLVEEQGRTQDIKRKRRDKINIIPSGENCYRFFSYEKDLLNFQSQQRPPFVTVLKKESSVNRIKIRFPEDYCFTSEGRKHRIFTNRDEITANLSISKTSFKDSGINVWSITFSPGIDGNYFTEYDIIKLAGYFGSIQEDSVVSKMITFKISEEDKWVKLDEIVSRSGLDQNAGKIIDVHTGIIQIDSTEVACSGESADSVFAELYSNITENSASLSASFKKQYYENPPFRDLMNVLCGFTLGIFDFQRMESKEVIDTIQATNVFSDSITIIARGNLISIAREDEIFNEVLMTIGVSPYILIPSVYLAHNEFVLSSVRKQLDSILKSVSIRRKTTITELENVLTDSLDKINNKVIINPFQYPTENNIINKGTQQRGIEQLGVYVKFRIEELATQITHKKNFRALIIEAFISSFLLLISLLQISSIFDNFSISRWIVFSVIILIMAVYFLLVVGKSLRISTILKQTFRKKLK